MCSEAGKEKGGQGDRPKNGHKTSLKSSAAQLSEAAAVNTELTCEKIVLMLLATFGMIAPAATATKPAMSAYSIRSCPRVSFHN
jgi:hypothetical protein